ncbi:MAG TPA: hypothetical protein VFF73_17400 [Planctomycetota bacterium]|nr:hypothetical protein [Planctomycetota bacterium]
MPPLDLDAAALRAYVLGSLHARGSAHGDLASRARRALRWYREVVARGGQPVLFSLVYDVGFLLLEAEAFPFRSLVDLPTWRPEEREVRLAYENRLLNTLLRDPSFRRASEAIAKDATRDDLIARAVSLILGPLIEGEADASAPRLNPVLLRELEPKGHVEPEVESQRWTELAGEQASHLALLKRSVERLLAKTGDRATFGPEDLAEIEHWSAYKRAAQRLMGRRIAARAAVLPAFDPRRARVAEDADQETELPDAGYYPEGGFSELANRGSLENLVPSELIYLGEEAFAHANAPDLFAVRYLEREALFYKRDSGQLQRVRRTVHIAVAPEQGLRIKLPWHPDALAIVLYGLFVRLVEDLAAVFPRDALRVEIHILAEGTAAEERAREDQELLRVLLRHEVARGTAGVTVAPSLDLRTLGERTRRVYGIAVQCADLPITGIPDGPPPAVPAAALPRLVVLKVGGEKPPEDHEQKDGARRDGPPPVVFLPTQGSLEDALVRARDDLVAEITGTRSVSPG